MTRPIADGARPNLLAQYLVAEHHDRVPVWCAVVGGLEHPAECGSDTEQAKVVARHKLPVDRRLRRPVNADVQPHPARPCDSGEYRLIAGQCPECGVRILVANLPQPLRILDGQGTERDRI